MPEIAFIKAMEVDMKLSDLIAFMRRGDVNVTWLNNIRINSRSISRTNNEWQRHDFSGGYPLSHYWELIDSAFTGENLYRYALPLEPLPQNIISGNQLMQITVLKENWDGFSEALKKTEYWNEVREIDILPPGMRFF